MDPHDCRTTCYYHFHILETLLSSHFLAIKRSWFHLVKYYSFFHKYLDIIKQKKLQKKKKLQYPLSCDYVIWFNAGGCLRCTCS